nr:hypothetical protein GCM10020093_021520 [Planobispora longispora]
MHDDTAEIGLRFRDVAPATADRIHRHVMAALTRQNDPAGRHDAPGDTP